MHGLHFASVSYNDGLPSISYFWTKNKIGKLSSKTNVKIIQFYKVYNDISTRISE